MCHSFLRVYAVSFHIARLTYIAHYTHTDMLNYAKFRCAYGSLSEKERVVDRARAIETG